MAGFAGGDGRAIFLLCRARAGYSVAYRAGRRTSLGGLAGSRYTGRFVEHRALLCGGAGAGHADGFGPRTGLQPLGAVAGCRVFAVCGVAGDGSFWTLVVVPALDCQLVFAVGRLCRAGLPLCDPVGVCRAGQFATEPAASGPHPGRRPVAYFLARHAANAAAGIAPRHGVCCGHRAGRICRHPVFIAP